MFNSTLSFKSTVLTTISSTHPSFIPIQAYNIYNCEYSCVGFVNKNLASKRSEATHFCFLSSAQAKKTDTVFRFAACPTNFFSDSRRTTFFRINERNSYQSLSHCSIRKIRCLSVHIKFLIEHLCQDIFRKNKIILRNSFPRYNMHMFVLLFHRQSFIKIQ